ncbi:hypothetical protein K227x_23680 [Rubripirellula lacrimiformis]|uniref:Uncharacterized protein n=1 Tax=Rubripirellula lacrimiformis TaxID=1930273 RepID=A0A517NA27_9BACT|nr:hypothetical protein [Rubripirellula lacrimiformis]QDT03982.1 hypothetical protein K227x_23680 [Rubripirellula lacrimiformis]
MRIAALGFALIVGGIAIFAFTLVELIDGAALDPQTKVPGTVTAEIDSPGRYYVWDNHWTMFDGERLQYDAEWPDDARIAVRDASGEELKFVPDASQNWSIGNNEKTSVGYVDVPLATTIQLDVDDVGRDRIVTVSNRTMEQELWSRLGGFGVALVVGILGVPICLLGLFLSRRSANAEGDSGRSIDGSQRHQGEVAEQT